MTEEEILAKALEIQSSSGLHATVEVLIKRFPHWRYAKQLRLRPRQGPWGRITAITPDGTLVQYDVHRLISFLVASQKLDEMEKVVAKRKCQPRAGRVKINPWISESLIRRVTELCAANNLTLSATIDNALREYVQRNA